MGHLLDKYRSLMSKAGISKEVIDTFLHYLQTVIDGATGYISSASITPPKEEKLVRFDDLNTDSAENLEQLVVIKLNGGLGTTMGLKQAKSLIAVKDNLNFLDVIALQNLTLRKMTGNEIPLIFMNSFNTDEDTLNYLKKYPDLSLDPIPLSFAQNKYPRIRQDDFAPYINHQDEMQNWNPPGHGDIYQALVSSSVLQKLLDRGIKYAFISNADNLGAIVDTKILNYIIDEDIPFLMEVCNRKEIDNKGGHLAQTSHGLILREIAQCPQEELQQFQDIDLYRYFNTNNIWINLEYMKKQIDSNNFILPLIVNGKTVEGTKVYQIETAMGAAIALFSNSKALIVPRKRFAPVKKTSDLITIRSDCYMLTDQYTIALNPECKTVPTIELDDRYYQTLNQLEKHFPAGIPSLKKCRSLKIEGDVTFGEDIIVAGEVTLKTTKPRYIDNVTLQ